MNHLTRVLVPEGWTGVLARAVMTGAAGFAALVLKEWLDTREWDFLACATDAAWVAGAVLVLNALLVVILPPRTSSASSGEAQG